MKILLSGGWGYGNLGDDAILHASLRLLKQTFPDAEIIIFSYDPTATIQELNGAYRVFKSVHRLLFGKSAFHQLSIYKKSTDLTKRYSWLGSGIRHIKYIFHKICPPKDLEIDYSLVGEIEPLFRDADMFIMSGGGYFNNWKESILSRMEELRLAQKYGLKNYIIGQTLDAFHVEYHEALKTLFQGVTGISVRDERSQAMLSDLDITSKLTPDLALSGLDIPIIGDHPCDIVFIPAELPIKHREALMDALSDFIKEKSLRIKLVITRLYNGDIIHAKWCVNRLHRNGVDVQFHIPKNFGEVWNDIAGAKYIISRNLHGLILGYIGGGNILSLNDLWKFEGFLKQIGHNDAIIKFEDLSQKEIYLKLINFSNSEVNKQKRSELREQVEKTFSNILIDS